MAHVLVVLSESENNEVSETGVSGGVLKKSSHWF